ncbi:uncharacterized protein [Parasteatoda tepidariorum]|uniref:uncharacterized protein isoform X3 n=1 Tax=Parasteatoda tepidariorum TaxID=114398 RepID=UPI0039BD858D
MFDFYYTLEERLDNLAFTSFPEDYLPYASSYQNGREGKAPPYLVWDERRPRRSRKRRRRGCCNTAALVSAIALIITAILAVVAISVYLGVVTNLFRSPVLSLSGKFRVSDGDEFSDALSNTTSYQFLVKAETYQAMVENVFLTSSLEPAFIAARIYAFRPGLLVFFRVYLDRRKLQQDDSSVIELVKDLVRTDSPAFGALSIDKESVDVDENEEWLAMPGLDNRVAKVLNTTSLTTKRPHLETRSSLSTAFSSTTQRTEPTKKQLPVTRRPSKTTTSKSTPQLSVVPKNPVPVREVSRTGTGQVISIGPLTPEEDTLGFSYGQWKPVPIEDSVSPSFGDQRTPPGRGSVRLLEDAAPARRNPPQRPPPSPPPLPRPSGPSSLNIGVGSVSVLEDPLSHVDPIPVRNLRPLRPILSEGHQVGDVASSIMSSVSLVVRKPKANQTSVPESGKLEMARPLKADLRRLIEEPPLNRKEHASFRFLEDEEGPPTSDKTTTDDLLSSIISDSSESEDDSPTTTDDIKVKSEIEENEKNTKLLESFVEYAEETGNRSEVLTTTQKEETVTTEQTYKIIDLIEESKETSVAHEIDISSTTIATTPAKNVEDEIHPNEAKLKNETLPLYSLKSDIGLRDLNRAEVVDTLQDNEDIKESPNLEEEEILPTELSEETQNITGHESMTTTKNLDADIFEQTFSRADNADIFEMTGTSESAENLNLDRTTQKDKFESSHDYDLEISSTHSQISSDSSYTHEATESSFREDLFEDYSTSEEYNVFDTTNSSLSTENFESDNHLIKNVSFNHSNLTLDLHTKEGHGFHQPIPYEPSLTTRSESFSPSNFPTSVSSSEEAATTLEVNVSPDTSSNKNSVFNESNDEASTVTAMKILPIFNFGSTFREEQSSPGDENTSSVSINALTDAPTTAVKILEQPSSTTVFEITETSSGNSSSSQDSSFSSEILDHLPTESTESVEIQGGVPKIVDQFQDLGFNPNDIDSNDAIVIGSDNDLINNENFDPATPFYDDFSGGGVEIIRHITTIPPTSFAVSLGKHPIFISNNCSEDEMQCRSGECVDLDSRCNMRRDCRDNSDEKNCSCSELLKVMGQSQKICDGIPDCKDLSDENNCPWCGPDQIICPQTKFCINTSQVCDGENNCPMGTDEKYCVKLAESVTEAQDIHYRPEGYLMVRKEGQWGKLCLDSLHDSDSLQKKMDELGKAVCSALTYRTVSTSSRAHDSRTEEEQYFSISHTLGSPSKKSSAIFEPSSCHTRDVMRVRCKSLDCGHRPMGLAIRRRIVGGQSANSGSWPWQVALYKEGDFQCGAVLISDIWLVSAGHCFYSTQNAFWTARLGLLRRGSELPSPSEQIRRIEQIILHPEYVDKGFINDISLLRMDRPVLFSDYLRPLCLPLESEDANLWHGKNCSVVGWGKLFEIGHTFPDSLQEVRLPVISTEECRKKIIFLSMYHITDNMFCAGYDRGGQDACLGDSGGPLMCQRDDGRWILLGVTSNGDGCGRPERPGVYTKVARYLSWINSVIDSEYIQHPFNDTCEGVRCNLGRCIPPYKMCDNRWDCSEGTDEDNCVD